MNGYWYTEVSSKIQRCRSCKLASLTYIITEKIYSREGLYCDIFSEEYPAFYIVIIIVTNTMVDDILSKVDIDSA
jgi:hypothetical protein